MSKRKDVVSKPKIDTASEDTFSQPDVSADVASASTAAPHPEEMNAAIDVRVGNCVALKATARATPAGLMTMALLVSAVLIPALWIARSPRSR
jgi:hypothetical protein